MKLFASGEGDRPRRGRKSGLGEAHRLRLMRMIFLSTATVLSMFAVFQFFNGNPYLALGELIISAISLFSASRIGPGCHLPRWIIGYLIPAFCFFVFIVVKPGASPTASVWIFMMPILSYLLLGRVAGFILAAPFMAFGGAYFFLQLEPIDSARIMIDLLNPIACGVTVLVFMHLYESMRADDQTKLVTLAETDALTGLANRSSFQSTLERTINQSNRSNARFALVLMDIDHFKQVNDNLGHDAGDAALRLISHCLSERLRNTDAVGRLGGEEFGLILRDVDTAGAYELVEELRQRIADSEMAYGGDKVKLTATFGIGHWPRDARRANDLYQVADRRLYGGKHAGRNVIVSDSEEAPRPSIETAGMPPLAQ